MRVFNLIIAFTINENLKKINSRLSHSWRNKRRIKLVRKFLKTEIDQDF